MLLGWPPPLARSLTYGAEALLPGPGYGEGAAGARACGEQAAVAGGERAAAGAGGARWEEGTRRFWCATGVNAYDIPDGHEWQRAFGAELRRHVGEGGAADADARGESPPTPRTPTTPGPRPERPGDDGAAAARRPGGAAPASPETPRKERQPPPQRHSPSRSPPQLHRHALERSAARAAHTKALLGMGKRPGVEVFVDGQAVALYRFGGRVFAVGARCPHQGGRLSDGEVGDIEDTARGGGCRTAYVTCPVHKMQFDLASGRVLRGSCAPLATYSVRLAEGSRPGVAMVEVGFQSLAESYFQGDPGDGAW
ncbi:unnamed protein product [Prorocentrum cordatum]|uniref:Rieske domain-containing protein n=1 Tax=Prorocentrum cordatum TaxID=2364126 RepID=A0ABN9TVG6_9DINO|nr:unnamed protein product [Polarella glacialis]